MGQNLSRFSVAMPSDLLERFDGLVAKRGTGINRSEVVRDLVRDALDEEDVVVPGAHVMGTLTIVFDHHGSDLQEKLHEIQHKHCESIVASLHIHVDAHTCLEVIVIKGQAELVKVISNQILGTKGVRHGKLVLTTTD